MSGDGYGMRVGRGLVRGWGFWYVGGEGLVRIKDFGMRVWRI